MNTKDVPTVYGYITNVDFKPLSVFRNALIPEKYSGIAHKQEFEIIIKGVATEEDIKTLYELMKNSISIQKYDLEDKNSMESKKVSNLSDPVPSSDAIKVKDLHPKVDPLADLRKKVKEFELT